MRNSLNAFLGCLTHIGNSRSFFAFTLQFIRTFLQKEVEQLRARFGENYTVFFPKATISRKIHELIFDVPRFLAKHKTVGLFSEEEGESSHKSFNQELKPLSCVRDLLQRLELAFKRQESCVELRIKLF